ncbi:permease [Paenibacillus lignilyticus]|uniref:Permease n=1 Tax=Paenibacillus lignilyticus TaxID=1172615 RepID=A0ABS5C9I5_9BACL|nr:permease [Paenibacillus lignilyticus]MBP3962307.1 permease [Paenibacillus lignilyticus]
MHDFQHIFISIIIEAFPFILLGVFFSALLQVFVSDAMIARITPSHPVAGVLFGCLLGLLLPLCECGMIPVVRRLIRKGMPPYIGMVFIFAGPIINPIVFASTFSAFRSQPSMAYSRIGLAFVVCMLLGLLMVRFMKRNPLKLGMYSFSGGRSGESAYGHNYNYGSLNSGFRERIHATFNHASDEFFDIGKYLIIGAFLTAIVQSAVDPTVLLSLSEHPAAANIFMMGAAFALSLCSTSDAFIASSFHGILGPGALLGFLVFGPMVDVKSLLMLFSAFRSKVIIAISLYLAAAVWLLSIVTEKLIFRQ